MVCCWAKDRVLRHNSIRDVLLASASQMACVSLGLNKLGKSKKRVFAKECVTLPQMVFLSLGQAPSHAFWRRCLLGRVSSSLRRTSENLEHLVTLLKRSTVQEVLLEQRANVLCEFKNGRRASGDSTLSLQQRRHTYTTRTYVTSKMSTMKQLTPGMGKKPAGMPVVRDYRIPFRLPARFTIQHALSHAGHGVGSWPSSSKLSCQFWLGWDQPTGATSRQGCWRRESKST